MKQKRRKIQNKGKKHHPFYGQYTQQTQEAQLKKITVIYPKGRFMNDVMHDACRVAGVKYFFDTMHEDVSKRKIPNLCDVIYFFICTRKLQIEILQMLKKCGFVDIINEDHCFA